MYALNVTAYAKSEQIEEFIRYTDEQVRETRLEPGNLAYEVIQSEEDPCLFIIHEVYRSKDDFLRHRTAPHCLAWKARTEPLLQRSRAAVRGRILFPTKEAIQELTAHQYKQLSCEFEE